MKTRGMNGGFTDLDGGFSAPIPTASGGGGGAVYKTLLQTYAPYNLWMLDDANIASGAVDSGSANIPLNYTPNSGGTWTGGTLRDTGPTGAANIPYSIKANAAGHSLLAPFAGGQFTHFDGTNKLTLLGWANRGTASTFGFTGANPGRTCVLWYSDGNVYYTLENTGNTYSVHALSGSAWHFFAMTYDGTAAAGSRLLPYLDGSPLTPSLVGAIPATIKASIGNFYIGVESADSIYSDSNYAGVALLDTVLSAAQIAALYAAR